MVVTLDLTFTTLPTGVMTISRNRARSSCGSLSSYFRITSPIDMPACSAGPPGVIQATIEPCGRGMPIARAISGVTCWILMPIQPGRTQPYCISRPITNSAASEGMASPSPAEACGGREQCRIDANDTPLHVEQRTAGVAVIDRCIGLDVVAVRRVRTSRLSALTIPAETDRPRPSGLPMANTWSPTLSLVLSPHCAAASGWSALTCTTARSASRDACSSVAGKTCRRRRSPRSRTHPRPRDSWSRSDPMDRSRSRTRHSSWSRQTRSTGLASCERSVRPLPCGPLY